MANVTHTDGKVPQQRGGQPPAERFRRSANNVRELYFWIRTAILNGRMAAGQKINQAQLAAELQVSRTPLREALRMLQAEGLVVGELNQRMVVARVSAADVDALYAERILLEALGVILTVPHLAKADIARIQGTLKYMNAHSWIGDRAAWEVHHATFHGLLVMHVRTFLGAALAETVASLQLRSERFRRSYVESDPHASATAAADHARIVAAVARKDAGKAARELSQHLSRTAVNVMQRLTPGFEPRAVNNALALVNSDPASLIRGFESATLQQVPEAETGEAS